MSDTGKTPENDIDLFRDAMSDVESHRHDTVDPYRAKKPPRRLVFEQEKPGDELADLKLEAPEFFEFRRPGIQHRLFHDLQRGLLPPEQSLDLHGMRVTEARVAFSRFLDAARQRGIRCIRIIHGKGRGSHEAQPVLKQKTYQWLIQTEAVLAFVTAPRWDGGSGATYVLLSRKFR